MTLDFICLYTGFMHNAHQKIDCRCFNVLYVPTSVFAFYVSPGCVTSLTSGTMRSLIFKVTFKVFYM